MGNSRSKSCSAGQSKKPTTRDNHHLLWPRKLWHKGIWSRRLREHPYMQARIPMYSMHQQIHQTINSMPVPNEDICEYCWYELEALRHDGVIDAHTDNIELKLDTLIEILRCCNSNLEVTIASLKWQKQVVHKCQFNK